MLHDAWAITDHPALLRRLLGRARDIRGEIDPRRNDHMAVILEAAAAFAIPFASLVGEVFRGFLKPDQRETLEDAVRMIVWGGREQYDFYNTLRRQVIAAKGSEIKDPLALPAWDQFLELLRAYLEAPHLSFQTPQVLRSAAMATISGQSSDTLARVHDRQLLHLALRLVLYLCQLQSFRLMLGTN